MDLCLEEAELPPPLVLTLEKISQKFGDDVAVHLGDASRDERERLERALEKGDKVSAVEAGVLRKLFSRLYSEDFEGLEGVACLL